MTEQPTDPPPTLKLGPGSQIFADPFLARLTDEEKRWAHLLSDKRDLSLLVAIFRHPYPGDLEIVDEWKNLWLISHQDRLWIYGFSAEERRTVFQHLKELRAAGYYQHEFAAFEENRAREEWGC